MTTIVVDRKERIMAADRQLSVEGNKYSVKKITRLYSKSDKESVLIATSGDATNGFHFEKWFKSHCEQREDKELFPKNDNPWCALVLYQGGDLYLYVNSGAPLQIEDRFCGIGSGSDAALGALYAGADIKTAIRIAAKIDSGTGMGSQIERLQ